MAKHRAIPKGYMTVGEVAKKIGVLLCLKWEAHSYNL